MIVGCFLVLLASCAIADTQAKNLVDLAKELNLGTAVQLMRNAGLVDTLATQGPFTLFVPSDAAFAKLSKEKLLEIMEPGTLGTVLKNHATNGTILKKDAYNDAELVMLSGQKNRVNVYKQTVTMSGSSGISYDNMASNGVIHIMDSVIFPATLNLVELAQSDINFSTLLTALQTADLLDQFKGAGPYTIFAPTNYAFSRLGDAAMQKLLGNKALLIEVLTYHVVPKTLYSAGFDNGMVATLGDKKLHVGKRNGTAFVNFQPIYEADVSATNGAVHVINEVLLPA